MMPATNHNFSLYEVIYHELKALYKKESESLEALDDHLPVIFAKVVQDGLGKRIPLVPVQFEYDVVQEQWESFQERVKGQDFHTRKKEFEQSGLVEIIGKMPPFYVTAAQLPILQQSADLIASIHLNPYEIPPDEAWEAIKPQSYVVHYVKDIIESLGQPLENLIMVNHYGQNSAQKIMQWDFLTALGSHDWIQNPDIVDIAKYAKDFGNSARIVANCNEEQGVLAAFATSEDQRFTKMVGLIHYEKSSEYPLWNIIQVNTMPEFNDVAKSLLSKLQELAVQEQCLPVSDRLHHPEIDNDLLIWDTDSQTQDYVQGIMDEYLSAKKDHEPYSWELPEAFKTIAREQASSFIVQKWIDCHEKPDNYTELIQFIDGIRNSPEYQSLLQKIDSIANDLKNHTYLQEYLWDFHQALYKGWDEQEYYQEIVEIVTQAQQDLKQVIQNPTIDYKKASVSIPKP